MKKLLLFFSLILSCCLVFPYSISTDLQRASASTSKFLRVVNDTTPFFARISDSQPLFFLPYTYYVKLLDVSNGFCHVECLISDDSPTLDGYVPENMLFEDNLSVINPYPDLLVTTSKTAVLYQDTSLTTTMQYVFSNRSMRCYGNLPIASGNLYFVEYSGKLGYVKESDIFPFTLQNHPNELTFIQPEPPLDDTTQTPTDTEQDNFFSLKVIIIACLLFAGIIALFASLKQKPKQSVAAGYYEENDYE